MGIELVAMVISLLSAGVAVWQAKLSSEQAMVASQSGELAKQALQETRIEHAVRAWKEKGQPDDYLDSIPELGPTEKQTIRWASEKRHKGR